MSIDEYPDEKLLSTKKGYRSAEVTTRLIGDELLNRLYGILIHANMISFEEVQRRGYNPEI